MLRKIAFSQPLKTLLLAGLLAVPLMAFNAMAAESDTHWSPSDIFDDGNGPYAYFADPLNWDQAVTPDYTNSGGAYVRVMDNQSVGNWVKCIITNNANLYQVMIGAGGGGDVLLTNGAQVTAGVGMFGGPNQWTGVGFPTGPAVLTIGTGASLTCGDHLWVGQGISNGDTNQVIIDGGTLNIHGQLGVGWNAPDGTNYITLLHGGQAILNQWASQTLGQPGNNCHGVMNLADNSCKVIINGDVRSYFPGLVANNQLIAYGGLGTIQWSFNPISNKTTISAVAPITVDTPVITGQPTNVVASLGGTASFHVQISNVPVNYGWMFNGSPLADGGGISGSHSATLTITGITALQIGSYSVMATNQTHADQFVTSTSASLSTSGINLYPVITILGVPGNTYVTYSSPTVNGTYTPFATNTINSFAPFYVVDTSAMAVSKFYKTVQQ